MLIGGVSLHVLELRRYPVKSMGGEVLDTVVVDSRGLAGDRQFAVQDAEGYLASGKSTRRFRRRDPIFEYRAVTGRDGVLIERGSQSWAVDDPVVASELSRAMGESMRVVAEQETSHHDTAGVSLVGTASLEWCCSVLGVDADPRRLRANIVVNTTQPFIEEAWTGCLVTVGEVTLRITDRTERCRMVDLAQDGITTRSPLLKALAQTREARLGVYAEVIAPGRVAVGDAVLRIADR